MSTQSLTLPVGDSEVRIRSARAEDLDKVTALDAEITGLPKPHYWRDLFAQMGDRGGRAILVAERDGVLLGFLIGEVRAWEFGSQPCGWIFALSVRPDSREGGIASAMYDLMCDVFREAGVQKVRTMLRRDDVLLMSFFRSQGMMAGPFVQMEKDLLE